MEVRVRHGLVCLIAVALSACGSDLGLDWTSGSPTPSPTPGAFPLTLSARPGIERATFTWADAPGATSYTLYLDGVATTDVVSPHTIEPLAGGETVTAIVTAIHASGESLPSSSVDVTPLPGGRGGLTPLLVPLWTGDGATGSSFGYDLAFGDVNNDGFSDVVVGEPGFAGRGRVLLYYGSASGLETMPTWTMQGEAAADEFGYGVAIVDVDGDEFGDVIVGAHRFDVTDPALDSSEGQVTAYHGSANGPSMTADWTSNGEGNPGARFGMRVASAGDVNNDGFGDVLIAAPFDEGTQADEGRVRLYLGSMNGLAATSAWRTESNQVNANYGEAIGGGGDVNNDGFDDVIVGIEDYDVTNDEGRAQFYFGGTTIDTTMDWFFEGETVNDDFGEEVSLNGDVNGDGFDDLLIGAEENGAGGRAYVFYGSDTGPDPATPDWTSDAEAAGDAYGRHVRHAGDVNGDGYGDVLIAAGRKSLGGGTALGRAYLYLGANEGPGPVPGWTIDGVDLSPVADNKMRVEPAGDINGDGSAELIISSPDNNATDGQVFVYYGPPSAGPVVDASAKTFTDPAFGGNTVCTWSWGDGSADEVIDPCTPSNVDVPHSHPSPGSYSVKLTVTNEYGVSAEAAHTLIVP